MNHEIKKRLKIICIFLAIFFIFTSLSQAVQAQIVTATIPVGTYPTAVAITPDCAYVYVTNDLDSSVSVISTSNSITPPIPTASPVPSPTIPEFSSASLILIVVCVSAVTMCAVVSAHKKSTRTNSDNHNADVLVQALKLPMVIR